MKRLHWAVEAWRGVLLVLVGANLLLAIAAIIDPDFQQFTTRSTLAWLAFLAWRGERHSDTCPTGWRPNP